MAMSIVPRGMATLLLSLALFTGSHLFACAQSVQPSNVTISNAQSTTNLQLSGGVMFDQRFFTIAPLTESVGLGMSHTAVAAQAWNGSLTPVDSTSANNLTASAIAFISCDPDGSNIDPSQVVGTAADRRPMAIVLYSLTSLNCNLNGTYPYQTFYTMIAREDSKYVLSVARMFATQGSGSVGARIGINNGSSTGSYQSGTNPPGNPAPTTAAAMSILYSVTGVITLLFLVIIATGAVRAHRHPERYGPRTGTSGGRPAQSRARGLSRAILETLPLVKFGDKEPVKPGNIELEDGQAHTRDSAAGTTTAATHIAQEREGGHTPSSEATVGSREGAAEAGSVESGDDATPNEGDLGCSICTEDFTTGDDVRVLPCNHKYHPACIDPWLLNVSGTCPLCRHDLRPAFSAEGVAAGNGELPPPLPLGEANDGQPFSEGSAHHRHRVPRILDISRLRHAPAHERIAALRQLRQETQRAEESTGDANEPSRRARLTGRLRDTFRVRTRVQNDTTAS